MRNVTFTSNDNTVASENFARNSYRSFNERSYDFDYEKGSLIRFV